MLRKLSFVTVAALSLGAAALAPSPAAAWGGGWHGGYHEGWHGGWHRWGWGGPRFVGGPVSYGYGGCYARELVPTPWGPRWRLVNRCY
ncbi:sulfur globule protein precursor [Bradyrhizobium sp.]|uniref:sulfur globule protein precursor n=1 Tax=Bradyrhizobium sp. TaxID=376 RepID=UPI003C60F77A